MKASLTNKCIGFIGVGVMGSSIIKSLLLHSLPTDQICITDKNIEKVEHLAKSLNLRIQSVDEMGKNCDVILLAVKPQELGDVLDGLKKGLKDDCLVISIAAGKKIEFIEKKLSEKNPVIRVMPNTPAQIGKGISAFAPGKKSNEHHLQITHDLFSATGVVIQVAEQDLDVVTALSGSGPAYFFYFVESMIKSGVDLGLTQGVATKLAIQTIAGSAAMLLESGADAADLRKNVTSPNGTTAAALQVFSDQKLDQIITQAMTAAKNRAQELA